MKRLFDLIVVFLTVPITLPMVIAISLLIWCEGSGPLFFKSMRIGRFGKPFFLFKFRTMYLEGDNRLNPEQKAEFKKNFKLNNDPRITPLGRWLRRTSLDELPQLINVVKGDMSLVGPRPKLPDEIGLFGDRIGELLSVPPGITGFWQIYRTTAASDETMRNMELHYVERRSLLQDIAILFCTPWRILFLRNE